MYTGSGYSGLIDEYTANCIIDRVKYAVPDIVHPNSAPADRTSANTVRLVSTPQGCREWIRWQLLQHEHKFVTKCTLTIFAGTWNVNGKKPEVSLEPWLRAENLPPDIFVIGFQEIQSLSGISVISTDETRAAAWQLAVETCIGKYGEEYVTSCVKQMVGILLIIMVKKQHSRFVHNFAVCDVGTGFMRIGGNKGAVSCRFTVYDKTICCVTSHLAAHGHNVERRNQDFHDVVRKASFQIETPVVSPFHYRNPILNAKTALIDMNDPNYVFHGESKYNSNESSVTLNMLDHDVVLWIGDLNYRIDELHPEEVLVLIGQNDWPALTKHDQLLKAIKCGKAFNGFKEMPLSFAPTYKYKPFEDDYNRDEEDKTLKRTPAWTDRILWLNQIKPLAVSCPEKLSYVELEMPEETESEEALKLEQPFSRCSRSNSFRNQSCMSDSCTFCLTNLELDAESGFKAESYRRHDLYSSDHRPVSARFVLDVSVLSVSKRNMIVENVHTALCKRIYSLRPRLSLSSTVFDLGLVKFCKSTVSNTPLIVSNLGYTPFSVRLGNTPSWLHTSYETGSEVELLPSKSYSVRFQVHIQTGSSFTVKLNTGSEKLKTCVPILINGNAVATLLITGQYCPTSYGNSIMHLVATPKPFHFSRDSFRIMLNSPLALAIPKEIHLLVSYLVRGCAKYDGEFKTDLCALHSNRELFLHSLSLDNVHVEQVRQCIDECRPIPDGTPTIAVVSCLLGLLESLKDPVVPYCCYDAVLSLVRCNVTLFNLSDLHLALQKNGAPAPVFNTLVYLHSFVNELPTMKVDAFKNSQPDVIHILSTFCRLILRPARERARNDIDFIDRLQFVKSMIGLCRQGALPAIFDSIVPAEEF